MDKFARILQRLPTDGASASNNHSGGVTPFKVQVNFEIPIFDGQIDADAVYRWMNLLEGFSSVHDFFDGEKIIFSLLKVAPMSRTGGKPTVRKRIRRNPLCSWPYPLGIICNTPSRNNIISWGAMRTSTYNGIHYNKGIKMCMSRRICSIPYAQSWVSNIWRNIWC